jgi:hypothetical protein
MFLAPLQFDSIAPFFVDKRLTAEANKPLVCLHDN